MIAIIPARGGSKRIPRKNIKRFCGKPIIEYSIEAALTSGIFDEVMVSTDDEEIAQVARAAGAIVPFMRSTATADDFATTADVLIEVLRQYGEQNAYFEHACCIYPTAPFVTAAKLQHANRMLLDTQADCVLPIARFSFPIWRSFQRDGDTVSYIWPENAPKRSQDLPPAFHDAGQFYIFKTKPLLERGQFITDRTIGMETPDLEVQDIDHPSDWALAELKYRHWRMTEGRAD